MEPKDLEDLYRVGDSNYLRQMSLTNANAAIQQAKMNFDKALEDYQMDLLSRRINGGGNNVLDRLKDEFEGYSILTIENANTLTGTSVHYKGIEWNIVSVERTSTTYNFLIVREYLIGANEEIKMILSRVPMAGKLTKVYSLQNDSNGEWVGIGKELLRDKNEFLKQMVGLTDAQN
jgi:hypothetical protein